jgi:hypothetical protein
VSDTPNDAKDGDDEPVPKLPYGRGLKLDNKMLFRIGATLLLLVLIIVATKPCANATSKLVTDFDEKKGSASEVMPKPGNVDKLDPQYEVIPTNATPEERDAAIARARAAAEARKARAGSGSATGSAGSASSGAGSARSTGSADRSSSAGSGSAK